jgi:outer membrane protein
MSKQGIINIVLGIGLAVMFVLHFSSSQSGVSADSQEEQVKQSKAPRDSGSTLNIGYIRTDSLLQKYERHKELSKLLEGKMGKMEREWERRTKLFKENLQALEEEAPRMSQRELAMAQQELAMKEQELMAYRERKTQEFMREEQELNKGLYEEVYDAINKVQAKLNLDMVFMLEMGGSLVWADEAFDITNEMAEELNRRDKEE